MISMRNWKRYVGIGVVAATLPAVGGLGLVTAADGTPTETRSVALDGATAARVELDMDYGELVVAAAAGDAAAASPAAGGALMDAAFTYEDDDWRPRVEYAVAGVEGTLRVEQPGGMGDISFSDLDDIAEGDVDNRWDVRLSPDVPLDLDLDVSAGETVLHLGGLDLAGLDVNAGVGDVELDFAGTTLERDVDATVDAHGGKITIEVPAGLAVRISADAEVGDVDADGFEREGDSYVTPAFGDATPALRLEVDGTVGEIDLEVIE